MKVLVAVDGSEHADKSLAFYFNNLHKDGNEVVVFNHEELPSIPRNFLGGMPMLTEPEINHLIADHHAKCKKMKHNLAEKCAAYEDSITLAVESQEGGAGHNIIKKAEACGAQLIVTGTRGLGAFRRTIIGSSSDYVMHHSKVPVVVCHF